MKKVVWGLIVALLIYSTGAGLWNGWHELRELNQFWHRVVAALSLAYGIAGMISLLALLWKLRLTFWIMLAWAALTFLCAITAVLVYTPIDQRWASVLPTALSLLAIFVPILILVRKNTR